MQAGRRPRRPVHPRQAQRGTAAVEFAAVAVVLFTLFFGVLEIARATLVCNTLQEVTRRAARLAAVTDFSDPAALQRVRERAVFRDDPGGLVFAEPVTDQHVKIDYLAIRESGSVLTMVPIPTSQLPASPAANIANCLRDRYGGDCIRFVRVRICLADDDGGCNHVPYRSLFSFVVFGFMLPESTTIVNAETLGLPDGVPGAS